MTVFAFENQRENYPEWAKHHEMVGIHVKRVYDDGRVTMTEDADLKKLAETHENDLLAKVVNLHNRRDDTRCQATDYYLPFTNQERKPTVPFFQSGASNTEQTMGIRYTFVLDNARFILEQAVKTKRNHPLLEMLDEDSIENTIREAAEKGDARITGIENGDENEFSIVVVDGVGDANIIDIELRELLDHLVAVEVFEFNLVILD